MKTLYTLIALLVLLLLMPSAYSQDLQFGPRAGLNFSTYTGEDANNFTLKPGVHVGGFVSKSITDRFSVQPELLFSMKGAARNYSSSRFSQTLYYLDVPLLCGLSFSDNIRALFGLQPSFYLGGRDKVKDPAKRKIFSNPRNLRGFDFGIMAGLEYKMDNGLNFGARISYGFLNISTLTGYSVNNLNLQATVGYAFGK